MTNANLLALAKQGEPKAIAMLMNRSLQTKGITAKAVLKSGCLQLMLESFEVPDKQVWSTFIHTGLINLEAQSIERVKIYGRQTGEKTPAWVAEFEITPQVDLFSLPIEHLEQPSLNTKSDKQHLSLNASLSKLEKNKVEIRSNFIQNFVSVLILTLVCSTIAIVGLGLLVDSSYFFSFGSIMFFFFLSFSTALGVAALNLFKKYFPDQSSFQSLLTKKRKR